VATEGEKVRITRLLKTHESGWHDK
jgi:hypothetical protein